MKSAYKAIGEIAHEIFKQDKTMSVNELEGILKQKGLLLELDLDVTESIGLAYDAFDKEGDPEIATCIAKSFTL
jgi:hypothetical protein